MNPPKGYYRQLLKDKFPEIRIAFTHTPIHGCRKVESEPILNVLDVCTDPYAKYYAEGIRNGDMVTIVENTSDYVYKPSELYFRS